MQSPKALLTTSCTHALEMAALLLELQPGDEVIMPSYTFASTADAFVMRGAKPVFVDIRPGHMCDALRRCGLRDGYDHGIGREAWPGGGGGCSPGSFKQL